VEPDDPDAARPVFDDVEQRVVGCLVEKALATPQAYPLTANALRLACNQATNRDPVVTYDDHTVESALRSLRTAGLIRIVYSPSNRASKYRHVLDEALGLEDSGLAVLAVLLLRGSQTLGELKARTERLHRFADLADVEAALRRLADAPAPLAVRLERRPGQKDVRWVHRLGPTDPRAGTGADEPPPTAPAGAPTGDGMTGAATTAAGDATMGTAVPGVVGDERIAAVEEAVASLTAEVARLRHRINDIADAADT